VTNEEDKLTWSTRLELCWDVLASGVLNPQKYRGKRAQEQWEICEQRRKELAACCRPRTNVGRSIYGPDQ